jgi:esterase/lipase superfamily enzyme
MPSYIFSTRRVVSGAFVPGYGSPDPTLYLRIPDAGTYAPAAAIDRTIWLQEIQAAAASGAVPVPGSGGQNYGSILIFVHGYNNSPSDVIQRHVCLQADLAAIGWKGLVVSYDWPSDDSVLAYLPDRTFAKLTAMALVSDGIALLAANQKLGCMTTVHLLGHSTGAYLIREAFDHADDNAALTSNTTWSIGQCVLIAGDISSNSMATSASDSIYLHAGRVTNYSNGCDEVLQVANVKRFGLAPRVGRVGLPAATPDEAVNVDCTAHFKTLDESKRRLKSGVFCHSWYFGDLGFTKDLAETLYGGLDRGAFPTRSPLNDNRFQLSFSP